MSEAMLRIAMRVEDAWWNAYVAEMNTMDGAKHIASIHMSLVVGEAGDRRKEMFLAILRDYLGEFIEEATGVKPMGWDLDLAPEDERKP